MSKKLFALLPLALLIALFVWVNTDSQSPTPEPRLEAPAGSTASAELSREPLSASDRTTPSDNELVEQLDSLAEISSPANPTEDELNELQSWYQARGRLSPDSDYHSYSLETLRAMADQGDMYAWQLLADEARRNNELEVETENFLEAAVHGSSQALDQLGRLNYINALRAKNQGDHEQMHRYVLESLTWYETAYLRGDLNARARMNAVKISLAEELALTDDELEMVAERAEAQYDYLSNRRRAIGYPEFDNEPHPVLQKYRHLYLQEGEQP